VFVSLVVTRYMDSISGAWKLMMLTGAGTGTVYLLRWYWWRINAWSEVVAMIVAAMVSIGLQLQWGSWSGWNGDDPTEFAYLMLATVAVTSLAWIAATFLTPAEPLDKLTAFYRRARPAGPGWRPVRSALGAAAPEPTESLASQFVNWILGCTLIYSSLFGIGHLVFKNWLPGAGLIVLALICGAIISRNLNFQTNAEG
jgi:solute:Na+ symporter, SSS family